VRWRPAQLAQRGGRLWTKYGSSFVASPVCGQTATTFSSTTTQRSRARRYCATSGVEVTRTFKAAGEVYATETPAGEAAVVVHRGPYNRMNEANDAIRQWMAVSRRQSAGHSWEIYGDPTPDPADTETKVVYS
jgi:effector-binding domain-containing protein